MNIYSKKTVWKRILVVAAMIIVALSFWYTQVIVSKVANEERQKVRLWADAIQRRAKLVNTTNQLFEQIALEERKRIELWTKATHELVKPEASQLDLAIDVIEANTTIPIIQTDGEGELIGYRNITGVIENLYEFNEAEKDSIRAINAVILESELAEMKKFGAPIEVAYSPIASNFLYYKDSKIFEEIKRTFNDIQNSFIADIVDNSATTPVVFINTTKDSVIAANNVNFDIDDTVSRKAELEEMASENLPISFTFDNQSFTVYYSDSDTLTLLKSYPIVQFSVIGLFILIGYWLFSIARNSEQNQVWVGMSKETAHQLGTPLSSLMGWIELLRSMNIDASITEEMDKDIKRLEMVTERFSKIGAKPELKENSMQEVIEGFISYMEKRSPKNVELTIDPKSNDFRVAINIPLFEWVLENLFKNAFDAMEGKGSIRITLGASEKFYFIDVADTGKGIPYSKRKTVFQPGYTSKARGWGLGLSLSKRIIEQYHAAKIFVKNSDEKGTTFRISFKQ